MTSGVSLAGRRAVVVNWRDVSHSMAGGAEIYAWQLARALHEGGSEVVFLTSRDVGEAPRDERDGIAVRRGGGRWGFYLFVLLWMLRHRRHVDLVVEAVSGPATLSPLVLRRRTPVLLILHHVHQAQFDLHFPAPVAAFGRWLERDAMRWVYRRHTTVAVSESTRAEMRSQLGWTGPIGLLGNGADLPSYDVERARDKDADRIVILGRLVAQKRVDLALRAIAEVERRGGRPLEVDVVGRGPEHDRLVDHAAGLGLRHTAFHGYLAAADKDAILASASLHLCASDAEGWGQTVIEAAAWGIPTVARDVPGLRDSVVDGETGWLVEDSAAQDVVVRRLAETLEAALAASQRTDDRAARAQACLDWAHRFDWADMREQTRFLAHQILLGAAPAVSDHPSPRDTRVAA